MPLKNNLLSKAATILGALGGGAISALAIGQAGGYRIYIGASVGLFRSTGIENGGILGWERLPEAPLGTMSLAVSPDFLEDHLIIAGTHTGIYFSEDFGDNWRAAQMPPSTSMVLSLCFSPNYLEDGTIFAGTLEDGIFISNNRGEQWYSQSFGLLDPTTYSLAISPNYKKDSTIFAATGTAMYYSYNAGRAWKQLDFPEETAPILSLGLQALDQGYILYAGTETQGLYASWDEGQSWQQLDLPATSVNALITVPERRVLLAATEKGILETKNEGQSWTVLIGLPDAISMAIKDNLVVAGLGDQGLWMTANLDQWSQVQNLFIRPMIGQVFSPRFEIDGTAYMYGPEEGIWETIDGGHTWEDINEALPSLEINGLGLSPDESTHHILVAASNDGILLSEDAGGTWRTVTPDPAQLVTISPNGRIIAAAFYGEGLRFSDDHGETWQNLPGPWDSVGGKMLALAVTNLHYYYIAHQEGMGEFMTLWQGKLGHFEKVLSEPAGENPHVTFWFPSGPATDRPWYASLGNQVWKVSGRSGGTHSHSSLSPESASSETILSLTGMQDLLDQILLFACTGQYIYKSQDARTWSRVHDFGDDRAVAIHLSSAFLADRTVYVLLLGGVFCKLKL